MFSAQLQFLRSSCKFIITLLNLAISAQVMPKKGRRSILDLEPLVQTECQIDEMKKKIKDLTQELLDMREQKVEVEKVRPLGIGLITLSLSWIFRETREDGILFKF